MTHFWVCPMRCGPQLIQADPNLFSRGVPELTSGCLSRGQVPPRSVSKGVKQGVRAALYAPSMRPPCAHYAPTMRPLCALYAPSMCPLCALYAPSMRPLCALYATSMRSICALYAPSMRPLCPMYAPSMRPLCALYAPSMHPLCAHYVPCMRPLCALHGHMGWRCVGRRGWFGTWYGSCLCWCWGQEVGCGSLRRPP